MFAGCDSGGPSNDLDEVFDCRVGTITLGQSISGTISSSDCEYLDDDGNYAFTLASSTTVVIMQMSNSIDSLYDGRARELEFDDDGGTGLDSRIERSLSAGTYVIAANTSGVEEGPYTLRLEASVE